MNAHGLVNLTLVSPVNEYGLVNLTLMSLVNEYGLVSLILLSLVNAHGLVNLILPTPVNEHLLQTNPGRFECQHQDKGHHACDDDHSTGTHSLRTQRRVKLVGSLLTDHPFARSLIHSFTDIHI